MINFFFHGQPALRNSLENSWENRNLYSLAEFPDLYDCFIIWVIYLTKDKESNSLFNGPSNLKSYLKSASIESICLLELFKTHFFTCKT